MKDKFNFWSLEILTLGSWIHSLFCYPLTINRPYPLLRKFFLRAHFNTEDFNIIFFFTIGKWLKDELDDVLKMDLAGLCRIPAVCFLNPSLSLERINLKHYEISLIEPLHDIKGHIKNMWELLPKHLSKDMEIFFQNELISILGKNNFLFTFQPVSTSSSCFNITNFRMICFFCKMILLLILELLSSVFLSLNNV